MLVPLTSIDAEGFHRVKTAALERLFSPALAITYVSIILMHKFIQLNNHSQDEFSSHYDALWLRIFITHAIKNYLTSA